jgi:hypothetical protein
MSRSPFRLAVLGLLVALALGLAACGGDDSSAGAGTDATALLKDTFGAGHPIRSGRVDADVDVALNGLAALKQPLSLHISGPFQSNGGRALPDLAFGVDFQGGPKPVTVGTVFAKGAGYLTIEGQAFDLGSGLYKTFQQGYLKAKASAAKSSTSASQSSLSALGISPLRWLKDPKNAGTQDIAGTETVHLTSDVDVAKLLEDVSTLLGKARGVAAAGGSATGTAVPTQLSAVQRALIRRSVTSATVDVWTGAKDHTLRKVAVDVRIAVPQVLRSQAGQLRDGHIVLRVAIAQLNQRQTIRRPASTRPIAELRPALEQLGLISPSASTTVPETATTPDATTPPAATGTSGGGSQGQYAQCVQSAGEDLAKVQTCARLLN